MYGQRKKSKIALLGKSDTHGYQYERFDSICEIEGTDGKQNRDIPGKITASV